MKGYFLKATFDGENQVNTLCLIINHPVWAWNRDFKLIGIYKNEKRNFQPRNEVLNQLVECRNS